MAAIFSGVAAGEVPLRATPEGTVFGTERFAVRLDARTGWAGEVLCDGQAVVKAADTRQVFDLRQGAAWVTGDGAKIEGRGVERIAPDAIRSRMAVGDWQMDACLQLFPERRMLRRWFEITWQGEAATTIKAFWFQGGALPLAGEGGYLYPAKYPPQRTGAAELAAGRRTSSGRSPYPLVAETGGGWSAVWVTDELPDYSDRGSVGVTEAEGAIRVTQAFNMQGHMRKGVTQKVGDAWLWLQPGGAEAALGRMRAWFEAVGQVPPADRPDWLKRVILYSFHPGGTIGSTCKDLGGFPSSKELLPHIRGLGCNAVWLMPLEDKSIYWPRDYYKLQEGLGTPEDYKAFTARARELGLRVWQDCVPHGGCNEFPRAKEHPEWLAQNEDGSTLYYWCFDFNWPTWIGYMRDVVSFYTREYGLDGFRIDACGGSYIPNWNPEIPYARASHAQAQGGLAMQRALREAVKAVRPDGANLAEVGASIHGAVSDSTYDFDLCYNVLHDFRKSPPEVFVPRLRRWLHEQQCAEIPDLVRMRHVESHDSLRAGLWYGADAQRALVALTAWIHGIPMVYHEMEDGHYEAYRGIFHVRREVEELNTGAADYLSVSAPERVFACLRTGAGQASVVLVNLSGQPVRGAVAVPEEALPETARGAGWARDLMTGRKVAARGGRMEVSLPPFGYTVLRFGARALPGLAPVKGEGVPAAAPAGRALKVASAQGTLRVDASTGLASAWQAGWWRTLALAMDVALPEGLAREGAAEVRALADGSVEAVRAFGGHTLKVRYAKAGDGVQVRAAWQGGVPEGAALVFAVPEAERWKAATAEGLFGSPFRVRHPLCDGVVGSIYRLPQGTAVLWDSRLHPFGAGAAQAQVGAEAGGRHVTFGFDPARLPASVQLLERAGDAHGLRVVLAWREEEHGVATGGGELVFTVGGWRGPEAGDGDARLTAVGGGWQFENAHYRARVSRNGVLAELWRREGDGWRQVVRRSRFYTDKGFGGDKDYGQENDVETRVRIERVAEGVRLRFVGEMRGFYRFDKMAQPVRYYSDYTFGDGPAFRRAFAFNAAALSSAPSAFLSQMASVEGAARVAFADAAGVFVTGERGDGRARTAQTAQAAEKGRLPAEIRVEAADGLALRLADARWFGVKPANVFLHGDDLHMAWMDGAPDNSGARQWNGVSLSVACADGAVAAGAEVPLVSGAGGGAELLRDGDFESVGGGRRLLIAGQTLSLPERDTRLAWQLPPGGTVVEEGGSRCVRVEGDGASYRLARQTLPVQAFPAGSVWRLSARVKGAGLQKADMDWKTACVRWALHTGEKTAYHTASLPPGDSAWRGLSAEMTVPEGVTGVSVEAGMNGNAGVVWVDDVRVERVR
jgi:hypothetical protein